MTWVVVQEESTVTGKVYIDAGSEEMAQALGNENAHQVLLHNLVCRQASGGGSVVLDSLFNDVLLHSPVIQ